jgi:ABC-2 type transport system ATP-binding protein
VGDLVGAHAVPVVELAFDGQVPEISLNGEGTVEGNRLRLPTRDPAATLVDVVPQLPPGVLSSVEIIRPNLEAVYLALTGRRYDEVDREGAREETKEKGKTGVAAK